MVASIPHIYSVCKVIKLSFVNVVTKYIYGNVTDVHMYYQIFELFAVFKEFITYQCVGILPCILLVRYELTFAFLNSYL